MLDGRESADPDRADQTALRYRWSQLDGPAVAPPTLTASIPLGAGVNFVSLPLARGGNTTHDSESVLRLFWYVSKAIVEAPWRWEVLTEKAGSIRCRLMRGAAEPAEDESDQARAVEAP